jgi:hypothetical protein
MTTTCEKGADGSLTLTIHLKPEGDLLAQETAIQEALQSAGLLAIAASLQSLDTNGSAIIVDNKRYTSRGQEKKNIRRPSDR